MKEGHFAKGSGTSIVRLSSNLRDNRRATLEESIRPAFAGWIDGTELVVDYVLVYPCQGHSDVHLHGNTARRRRRVTARVSIRPPDKRLLDPDDPTRSLVARLHATLWLLLGRPVETKFWHVLRDLETQPSSGAHHREESRSTSSPASAATYRKLPEKLRSINGAYGARFTSYHKGAKAFSTAAKTSAPGRKR